MSDGKRPIVNVTDWVVWPALLAHVRLYVRLRLSNRHNLAAAGRLAPDQLPPASQAKALPVLPL
ncbi:MAG: hypothetical protein IPK53_08865 [bacterium]|nr:hypothetical protein [bacterium]